MHLRRSGGEGGTRSPENGRAAADGDRGVVMTRWVRIAVVLMVPPTLVTVTSGSAWARSVATGSVTCTVVKGHARFWPPLRKAGSASRESITFRIVGTGCTTGDGSNLKSVASTSFKIRMPLATPGADSCATAMPANGTTPALAVGQWRTHSLSVSRTTLRTSGEWWNTSGANVTVLLPGNGTATNDGTSFAGTDSGANSTISLTFGLTHAMYAAVCDPVTGHGFLSSVSITGGNVALGTSVYSGFGGSAAWTAGADPFVPSDTDGRVLDLNSPQTCSAANGYANCSFAGFTLSQMNGSTLAGISALNYEFAVQTPGWSAAGGGSPRLILFLSDGGNVQLDSEGAVLTTGTWVHLDAVTGVVDNTNGTGESCGATISWSAAVSCHGAATVTSGAIVNDSGWVAPSGFDVWVDNVDLNGTVVSAP